MHESLVMLRPDSKLSSIQRCLEPRKEPCSHFRGKGYQGIIALEESSEGL